MNTILKTILVGLAATFAVDIWIYLLSIIKIKSLDYRYVGRWVANFPHGKFFYTNITKAEPVKGELFIGWVSHYFIGITFAFLLIVFFGSGWLKEPVFYHAVIIGILTAAAPLFIMQPAFGFGIASSKLPEPNSRRFKSLLTHLVYGIGLYLGGLLVQGIWN